MKPFLVVISLLKLNVCLFLYCIDVGHSKVEEQPQPNISDDSTTDTVPSSGIGKNVMNEDDLKASYTIDSPVCWLSFILVIGHSWLVNILLVLIALCVFYVVI